VDETGDPVIPPRLRAILAALDPSARQAVTEWWVPHAEFPAWEVHVPHRDGEWRAVRSPSDRPPDAGLPLIWTAAMTTEGLASRIRRIDAQLGEGQ
jgi:hypothetical protein